MVSHEKARGCPKRLSRKTMLDQVEVGPGTKPEQQSNKHDEIIFILYLLIWRMNK